MNLHDDYLLLTLEGVIAVCTFAASWGAVKANSKSFEKKIEAIEENYITRHEYLTAMADIKENARDMKTDVRRILDLLSRRGKV